MKKLSVDTPSSPKIPRKKQSIDLYVRTKNINDETIITEPKVANDNDEKIDTVRLQKDTMLNVRRPTVIKVKSDETRRSIPNDANIDYQNPIEEHSKGKNNVNMVKVKRLPGKTPKSKNYENSKVPEANVVTVTSVSQKKSKK